MIYLFHTSNSRRLQKTLPYGPEAVPRGPWLRKKISARHFQQNVSYIARQGPYTIIFVITLIFPHPAPLHTATGRLQRLLQPHREPLSSSCYTCSAGLGVARLEFVRYGLLIEVWSVPPRPPRKRHENAKFAGQTRAERHESVATHCGCDCAPSWRRGSPSGGPKSVIGRRCTISAAIV